MLSMHITILWWKLLKVGNSQFKEVTVEVLDTLRRKIVFDVVLWLSLLYSFIQLSLNWGSAQVQTLLAACRRFTMVRISDNGPGWKYGKMPFVGQPYHKNNSSSSSHLELGGIKKNKNKGEEIEKNINISFNSFFIFIDLQIICVTVYLFHIFNSQIYLVVLLAVCII